MEKSKLFKNKLQMVIYTAIFIICLILCIIIGKTDFKKNGVSDNIKFYNLYERVGEDNLYKFVNATEVLNILNGKSGIVLMGFPTNKWTSYYAELLNNVAKELKIDEIYYYEFLDDRDNNNGTYETIVNKMDAYIPIDDEGNKDIQAPTVIVVKNGSILGYLDDTAIMRGIVTPEVYYTEYEKGRITNSFKMVLEEYKK